MSEADVLRKLTEIVAEMSLSIYLTQTGERAPDDMWAGIASSCARIADLADILGDDET